MIVRLKILPYRYYSIAAHKWSARNLSGLKQEPRFREWTGRDWGEYTQAISKRWNRQGVWEGTDKTGRIPSQFYVKSSG